MNKTAVTYLVQALVGALLTAAYYLAVVDQSVVQTVLFAVGCGLAGALLFFDEMVFSKKYAEQGVTKKIVMTRSILFVLTLFPLGIFVTTSSGSSLGMGLLLSLLAGLLLEMFLLRGSVTAFNARFLSQLKHPWGAETITKYIAGVGFFWLFLLIKMFIV